MNIQKEQEPTLVILNDIMVYLNCYKGLNEKGRQKLMKYASDLMQNPKYTDKDK